MSKWKRDEVFRRRAKNEGYRSRAAFKLIEIEKRFQIFETAKRVVDLCSAPGSWLQVAKDLCSQPDNIILGVDIVRIRAIPDVQILQGSIDDPKIVSVILERLIQPADVVLSDCSPKLTGNKSLDRERQLWQATCSYRLALQLLAKNGNFVTKLFQSDEAKEFITEVQNEFQFVKSFKPKSSFQRSPEMYLVAKGFRG
ncbi:MAG: RlmE family RNA methyltransferase [Candidatus Hermodarchaeota archaeon]|nr:RlmE family RNA methyltransferase [Candidatus Hermodarchaeota archaeon]